MKSRYDDRVFFEKYAQMERSRKGLEGAGEWPTLEGMLPDLNGLRMLDLGCGYGWHCRYAIQHGASAVVGVDLSERMLERARSMGEDARITYMHAAMETIDFPKASFDLILSSLAFHYVADYPGLLKKLHAVRVKKNDPLEQEISKIVKKKKTKVKPNYKKKQKQQIETLRRRARREMIREDIRRQQKERAKEKMRQQREEEER